MINLHYCKITNTAEHHNLLNLKCDKHLPVLEQDEVQLSKFIISILWETFYYISEHITS